MCCLNYTTSESASTISQYNQPVQTASTISQYKQPVQSVSTNNQYKQPVQSVSTISQYNQSVQTTSTISQYNQPAQTASTNSQYTRHCHIPEDQKLTIPTADTQIHAQSLPVCNYISTASSSPLWTPACTVGGGNTPEGKLGVTSDTYGDFNATSEALCYRNVTPRHASVLA